MVDQPPHSSRGDTASSPPLSMVPIPDPTLLTTEALNRGLLAERDYVNGQIEILVERLHGMDRATELLTAAANRVPSDVDKQIQHLASLVDERFIGVALQFKERDTRSERESRDNKVAVDAAFAAQKEAASEQNKSNTLAISKSETATAETINKLAQLFDTSNKALADKIDDMKERLGQVEQLATNMVAQHAGGAQLIGWVLAGFGALVAIGAIAVSVAIGR